MPIAFNKIQSRQRDLAGFTLDWVLTPVQGAYALSEALIVGIDGPMGPGKSYASACAIAMHAQRNLAWYPDLDVMHAYVIRDTLENLKKSPIPTIQKVYGRLFETKNSSKEGYIYTTPLIHLEFIGMADQGDLSKLQGPEVALIWAEEVCAIADARRYNAGISEEVFNIAAVRATRQEGLIPRLQCSTNPGDEDSWYYRRIVAPPDGPQADLDLITKERFFMDPEKLYEVYDEETGQTTYKALDMIHLQDVSKQMAMFSWKDDPPMYTRMVEGKWAKVYYGKKVCTTFSRARHVATEILKPVSGYPAFRWYDSWGEPRCILGQQFPSGQVRIYKVISDHSDIRHLGPKIDAELAKPEWKRIDIQEWRDIGDTTMSRHDQSNKTESSAKYVEEHFDTTFEPGAARWETGLKSSLLASFSASTSDGEPCVLISPQERDLIAGLDGRWHYPTEPSGQVKPGSKPVKNEWSHACDALANGLSVLHPWAPMVRRIGDRAQRRAQQKRRAAGYAGGRVSYA